MISEELKDKYYQHMEEWKSWDYKRIKDKIARERFDLKIVPIFKNIAGFKIF